MPNEKDILSDTDDLSPDRFMKIMVQRQREFEKETAERQEVFFKAIQREVTERNSEVGELQEQDQQGFQETQVVSALDPDELATIIQDAVEQVITGFQQRISFRYRNDGAEGVGDNTHRLEFIIKPTPYITGTTFWPDDEWTLWPGGDAVVGN